MRIIQFIDGDSERVGVIEGDALIDLTAGPDAPVSVHDIHYRCGGAESGFLEAAATLARKGATRPLGSLLDGSDGDIRIRPTVTAPTGMKHLLRIWLAGVTHEDSAKLREVEAKAHTGQAINVYEQKYRECAAGGIPELFCKSDPDSCVGHGEPIARPNTTLRLVPETELVSIYALRSDGQVERIALREELEIETVVVEGEE